MQFISLHFFCFLFTVWLISQCLKREQRWPLFLISSLFFIGIMNPGALLVLLASSLLTFYAAQGIGRFPRFRFGTYWLSVSIQVCSLFLLKYIESGTGGLHFLFREAGFRVDILLFAVGFSFYTLQHIGYLTDVYQKRCVAQTSPLRFLLFSSFFAKFNSGPLEQPGALIPQFEAPHASREDLLEGLNRIALGVFKKMVLADRLAPVVSLVFNGASAGSLTTAAGVCLFTVQLYFDFSAYSDIAVGSAKLLGIKLSENFDRPFTARSVSEFWRRWHVSLIRWFTARIYFPVVFRFRKQKRLAVLAGIWVTFLLSGLWHGIGKTFVVWSVLHAIYLSYESLTRKTRAAWSSKLPAFLYNPFSMVITFLLVCFSNLFFRTSDIQEALHLICQLGSAPFGRKGFLDGFLAALAGGGNQEALFNLYITLGLAFLFLINEKRMLLRIHTGKHVYMQFFVLLLLTFVFGIFKHADYFIYLQF
jgi:alginate O-acetyltransferase complex protein AlgI